MRTMTDGTRTLNLRDSLDLSEAWTQPLVLDLTVQHQGNRVTRRFYPEHWAKVQYARWVQDQYGMTHGA